MKTTLCAATASALALACLLPSAEATPVQLVFRSSIVDSQIAGVSAGDAVTLTLVLDNGSTSLASQDWTIANLISGSLTAGTYTQSYVDGWFGDPGSLAFQTDAAGMVVASNFFGTTYSPNHTDSFGQGGGIDLFDNAFQDVNYNLVDISNFTETAANWSIQGVSPSQGLPEPNAWLLLSCAGIAALGQSRRVLRRTIQAA